MLNVMLLRCKNTTRRTDKQQMQSRVRKVSTLARTGEKGRALAAARKRTISSSHRTDCPRDQEPLPNTTSQIPVSPLFLSEVAEHVPTTLRKMPRVSEPGPPGMRAEHWYDFGSLAGDSDLFVQVVVHKAAAAVPNSVLQYLKAGEITTLAEPTGGHRPLLMMSFLRKEKNSGQVCGSFAVRCRKTRWSKHNDQNHPIPCGSCQLSDPCCS